jgi:hypothetical protein
MSWQISKTLSSILEFNSAKIMQDENTESAASDAVAFKSREIAQQFLDTILSEQANVRNRSFESLCQGLSLKELRAAAEGLDKFRRQCDNLYHQVRALFFLTAIYRYACLNC